MKLLTATASGWSWKQHTKQLIVKKKCTKVRHLFKANKPQACLVSLSSKKKPWGIAIFLLLYPRLWALLWGTTIHIHTFISASPHTAAHTKPFKLRASCWLRLYRHCIASLSLLHSVQSNRGEEQGERSSDLSVNTWLPFSLWKRGLDCKHT